MYCGCDLSFDFAPYFWGLPGRSSIGWEPGLRLLLALLLLAQKWSVSHQNNSQEGTWPGGKLAGRETTQE